VIFSEFDVVEPDLLYISNAKRDEISVYRQVGEGYEQVLELALERNDTLTTSLLPGLAMPLRRIFKD
jgi:hypothetical protein